MRPTFLFPLLALISATIACRPTSTKQADASASATACSGPALPGSGICPERAESYLRLAQGPRPPAPDGCQWVVNETTMSGGEYLLYYAAKCKDKVTALDYSGGAHSGELKFATAAMSGDSVKGRKIVSLFSVETGNPNASILSVAKPAIKNKAEAAKCAVRSAGYSGWPGDALVVDVSAAESAKARKDEPRTACGPYGLDEDSQTFWRVFQGTAWFFELGQDSLEVDPGSFTLVRKDEKGNWVPVAN